MKLTLAHSVPLPADVYYAARVRGPQTELIVNFGYRELCSLTCPAGAETSGRVKFPEGASDRPYLGVVIGGENLLNAPNSRVVFLKIEAPTPEFA